MILKDILYVSFFILKVKMQPEYTIEQNKQDQEKVAHQENQEVMRISITQTIINVWAVVVE